MKTDKFILTALICLMSISANAQFRDIKIKTTKVEGEQYRCLEKGGGFAIKTRAPQKIWQVDSDSHGQMTADGLDLEITRFNVFRCPHCYAFEALLKLGKQAIKYQGEMTSSGGEITLKVKLSGKSEDTQLNFKCQTVQPGSPHVASEGGATLDPVIDHLE